VGLSCGKPIVLFFVTSNRFIPVKNKQVLCAVVFCACETIHLLSVVFYIIRAVSDFDFRLVIKVTKRGQ
jgi:hypothetical protein